MHRHVRSALPCRAQTPCTDPDNVSNTFVPTPPRSITSFRCSTLPLLCVRNTSNGRPGLRYPTRHNHKQSAVVPLRITSRICCSAWPFAPPWPCPEAQNNPKLFPDLVSQETNFGRGTRQRGPEGVVATPPPPPPPPSPAAHRPPNTHTYLGTRLLHNDPPKKKTRLQITTSTYVHCSHTVPVTDARYITGEKNGLAIYKEKS